MNAIIGLSHLAMKQNPPDLLRSYLGRIQSASELLLGIINDILDLSKIEAGRLEIEHVPFSLTHVLNALVSVTTARAQEKGVEFFFDLDPSLIDNLIGDPLRLGQVLSNLVHNAVKFTEQGAIRLAVQSKRPIDGQGVHYIFTVQDSGRGIAPEAQKRLFQPFTQADSSTTRKYGGTGLGLSICNRLVHLMGGTIHLESLPEVGSTFIFDIPLRVDGLPRPVYPAPDTFLQGKSALFLKHRRKDIEHLERMLSAFGVGVQTLEASDVGSVPSHIENGRYDFILVDCPISAKNFIDCPFRAFCGKAASSQPRVIGFLAENFSTVDNKERNACHPSGFLSRPATPKGFQKELVEILSRENDLPPLRQSPSDEGFHFPDKRVLLIEDDETNREVAREILESYSLTVTEARNGTIALSILERESFDLIFMDLQMPEMDGFEATQFIRDQEDHRETPIIAFTANVLPEDMEKAFSAGMNDVLAKPIDPRRFFDLLKKWLGEPEASPRQPQEAKSTIDHERALLAIPHLDARSGIDRLGGDTVSYLKILRGFFEQQDQLIQDLLAACHRGDSHQTRFLAHRLKGIAGNISAPDMLALSRDLEKHDALEQRQQCLELVEQLRLLLNEMGNAIQQISSGPVLPTQHSSHSELELAALVRQLNTHFLMNDFRAFSVLESLVKIAPKTSSRGMSDLEAIANSLEFSKAARKLADMFPFLKELPHESD